ncbi:TPA: hypothetical protein N5N51_004581 [Enterobacter hormaechei subsp. xiangfangensis]|nr:hypothetical protein [Enterobacter hormaechei]HCM9429557.1 hypothetical protein [Enterobacter hormaechei subsp. xiangfangensis]
MNTQNVNVKTAAPESSRKMGEGRISHLVDSLTSLIRAAHHEAVFTEACAEEAHVHYGAQFGVTERVLAYLSGFLRELKSQFISYLREKR